jgi:protein ImuB
LKTVGDVARLPAADLVARLGAPGRIWHALASGEDLAPLVPDRPEERFDASLDLDWPIEDLQPLAFVLTRLLEPLSLRLEARDRGVARLHTELRLVTKDAYTRRLELPAPMRDVRTLRTLVVLDLESHPPPAAVDRVSITIDPTPGRILQHTLFTRPHPTPEQLATLIARLGAVMGQDRIGAPATVDSYRPDAFAMRPFEIDPRKSVASGLSGTPQVVSAVRRFRRPVPARVAVEGERPVRVTTDRAEIRGGVVRMAAGPWRSSGNWWAGTAGGAGRWDRDEWDIALADGAVYRVFQDRQTEKWFIEAIAD